LKISEKNKTLVVEEDPVATVMIVAETDSLGKRVLMENKIKLHNRAVNENVSDFILVRAEGWIANDISVPRTPPIKTAVICVYDINRGAFIAVASMYAATEHKIIHTAESAVAFSIFIHLGETTP